MQIRKQSQLEEFFSDSDTLFLLNCDEKFNEAILTLLAEARAMQSATIAQIVEGAAIKLSQ